MMETKERIRAIHINTASGLSSFVVGEDAAYSGQDKLTTVKLIDRALSLNPHGAGYVYRVHCEDGDIKERIEIPGEAVALIILEEVT